MAILRIILVTLLIAACTPEATTPTDPPSTSANTDPTPTRESLPEDNQEDDTGDDSDAGQGSISTDDDNDEETFTAEITGAVTRTISGSGVIDCENRHIVLRPTDEGLEQVTLILPPDISTGTYDLYENGNADNQPAAVISLDDNRVFAGQIDGVLVLQQFGTSSGSPIQGSYDFSATNGSEQVSARGIFEFTSANDVSSCE